MPNCGGVASGRGRPWRRDVRKACPQKSFDGIERADFIFLLVIPIDDIRQIRAAQVNDEKHAEQKSAEPGAFSGKNSGDDQHEKSRRQRKKQNEPAGLADAERGDGCRHVFVAEPDGLQIADEPWFF